MSAADLKTEARVKSLAEVRKLTGGAALSGITVTDDGWLHHVSAISLLAIVEGARDRLVEEIAVELEQRCVNFHHESGERSGLEQAAEFVRSHFSTTAPAGTGDQS